MGPSEQSIDDLKRIQPIIETETAKSRMDSTGASLSPDVLCLVMQSRDKGSSSLLNALPLKNLHKKEFKDSLQMRKNLPLHDLPSFCASGDRFNIKHALTCKKRGFLTQRYDGVRWGKVEYEGGRFSVVCIATAFFYLRVSHVNSKCNQVQPIQMVFEENGNKKKRKYQQRVLDVKIGTFTTFVFGDEWWNRN